MYLWKVAGVFVRLKGVIRYLKSPYLVRKAVFYLSSSLICILLNVVIIFSFVNYLAFDSNLSILLIKGKGYLSLRVIVFRF